LFCFKAFRSTCLLDRDFCKAHNTLVYFKVQAVKGSEEKTNSVSASATADTVGPTVSNPAIVVDVM